MRAMRRGILAVGAAAALVASVSTAEAAKMSGGNQLTMSGCGLGYMLFGKDHPSNRFLQILAVTTNASTYSQLFGITSGTSGCTEDGMLASAHELGVYAEVNFNNLSHEMAKGEGEYVTAFASLLGATDATRPALVRFFQERYAALFPSSTTTPAEMLETLGRELQQRPDLLG